MKYVKLALAVGVLLAALPLLDSLLRWSRLPSTAAIVAMVVGVVLLNGAVWWASHTVYSALVTIPKGTDHV
jgi:hypothetical protein